MAQILFKTGDRVRDKTGRFKLGIVWDASPGYNNSLGHNVLKIRWDDFEWYTVAGFHGTPQEELELAKTHLIKEFIHENL